MEEFWNEDNILIDYLFNTNLSQREIAKEMGWSEYKVSQRIKALGLGWIKRSNRKLSRGHSALLSLMQRLLPGEEVTTEHHVGEQLRLDIYCSRYKIGAEYHGRQHFYYVDHFHGSMAEFLASQDRDQRKEELCKEQGIALVVFRYNDELNEDTVFNRMLEAIQAAPKPSPKKETVARYKGNPYYEASKQRQREYRKKQYQRMKQQQKKRK